MKAAKRNEPAGLHVVIALRNSSDDDPPGGLAMVTTPMTTKEQTFA